MAQRNQLLNFKNKDEDEEKRAFERFEQDLKQNIFGIISLTLKETESSVWKVIALMIISEIQVLSMIFSKDINYPWKNDSFATYFKGFFNVFTLTYWCSLLNHTSYLTIFYIAAGILFISVLNLIYASYLFSSKQFTIMWPFHALYINFSLAITILYYPFIDLFSSTFRCKDGMHYMFDHIECWKHLHILHAVTGIVALLVFVAIYLIVSLCFFESRFTSPDASARANARSDFWLNFFKTVCNLMCAIFTNNDYQWIHAIIFALGGVVVYFKQREERSYYNEIINITADVNNGIFIWASLMLIIVMIARNSYFNGGIQAFLSGLPLIIIFFITRNDHRKKLLFKEIEAFDNGNEWYTKVRYYISFLKDKDMTREIIVELKGFIYNHEEKCNNKTCPLRIYIHNINTLIKDNKRKKQSKTVAENYGLLMRYANTLFLQGLAKFPGCTSLRIAYASFLKEKMNNRSLAINELLIVEKHQPTFDEQFLIFRYRKLIEDEMADVQADSQEGAMDAISMIAYDNYLKKFKEAIEKSAHLHMEFWLEVLELEPDLGKLDKTGSRIHVSIALVEDYWKKLQKINSNTPKALKLYAEFLTEILNDKEAGGELMSRAKDTVIARATVNLNVLDAAELMNMDDMCAGLGGADGTPCIVASGDQGKLGDIIQFNMALCRVFGYTKAELTNRKINYLMPDAYAKSHDKILQHVLNNNDDVSRSLRSDIFVLGKHKSNYLLPLILQTKTITSVTQGILFVGTFKCEKKGLNACYILLDEQLNVVGVSSRCIKVLKLSDKLLKNSRVSFPVLAPNIEDKGSLERYNIANSGAILEYYLPDTGNEEMTDFDSPEKKIGFSDVMQAETPNRKLRVKASKELVRLSCIISEITLLNESNGYFVRLEPSEEEKEFALNRKLDRFNKHPNIQFAFDPVGMRYFQEENEEDAQKVIAERTSMYVNIMRDKESDISQDKSDHNQDISTLYEEDKIAKLQSALMNRKFYGDDIKTMRLINGKLTIIDVKSRSLEKKLEEMKEEEKTERKQGEKEDIFQSSLKSKKAFNAALNEKSMPPSIKRLKISGYIIILMIIALASTEFGIILGKLSDIEENIKLIKYSRERISIQMQMAYYVNKIVLMKKNTQPNIALPDNTRNVTRTRDLIMRSLRRYYELQNFISLSKHLLSKEHERLYSEKVVTLYYKGIGSINHIEKTYTLTEAVQQLASEVFTVHSSEAANNFHRGNDNIDFVIHNSYDDLYAKLCESADFFIKELNDKGSSKKVSIYILYAFGLLVTFGSLIPLFLMVSSVSNTRLSVLSLFFDIPSGNVRTLEKKAEKFVSKSNDEVVDDILSNEGEILTGGELTINVNEAGESVRTGRQKKKFKNNKTSNIMFYLEYGIAVLIMAGYFSFNFATAYIFLDRIPKYSRELDAITGIYAEITTSFSIYQQLIGHREICFMTEDEIFQYIALDKIPLMYAIASEIQNAHNDNQGSYKDNYKTMFRDIMRDNMCDYEVQINFTFQNCETFLDSTLVEGLHPVIINYIEKLRERLSIYRFYMGMEDQDEANEGITKRLLGNVEMIVMELTVFEVIDFPIRFLIDALIESYINQYDGEITKRIVLFVCFLLLLIIAFIGIWAPFTNRLNEQVM